MTIATVEVKCPHCGVVHDRADMIGPDEKSPRPGDVSICFKCGGLRLYADDLTVRKATAAEISEMMCDRASWRLVEKIQDFIRRRRA